jgi:hypothetical protein
MTKEVMAPSVDLPDELPPSTHKTSFTDWMEVFVRTHYKDFKEYLNIVGDDIEAKMKRGVAAAKIKERAIEEGFGIWVEDRPLSKIANAANTALGRANYSASQRLAKKKSLELEDKTTKK